MGQGWGLQHYDSSTQKLTTYLPDERYPGFSQDWPRSRGNGIGPVIQSPDDASILWIGSRGGLYKFDKRDGTFRTFYPFPEEVTPDNHDPIGQQIQSLHISSSGTFWVGNRRGIFTFNRSTEQFTPIHGLSDKQSVVFYEDRSSTIWIGNQSKLIKITPTPFSIYNPFPEFESIPLGSEGGGIAETPEGNIVFGTKNGLIQVSPASNQPPRFIETETIGRNKTEISALFYDSAGNLWLGRTGQGVERFNPRTRQLTVYQNSPGAPHSIANGLVNNFVEDQDGMIWIGLFPGGLNKYNPKTDLFTRFLHDPNNPLSLGHDGVERIYIPPSTPETIWLATASGPSRFDIDSQTFTNYHSEQFGFTRVIYEDSKQRLWIISDTGSS